MSSKSYQKRASVGGAVRVRVVPSVDEEISQRDNSKEMPSTTLKDMPSSEKYDKINIRRVSEKVSSPSLARTRENDKENRGDAISNTMKETSDTQSNWKDVSSGLQSYTSSNMSRVGYGRRSSYGGMDRSSAYEPDELADMSVPRSWKIQDFSLGMPLGRGRFGNVYMARQRKTNVHVALKVLFKQPLIAANCLNMLKRELEIQCRLNHPNIVQLYGYFQDAKNVYLILEYINDGELFKQLELHGHISEEMCIKYMRGIASAVHYMHARHVYHRDIKPENILISDDGAVRLADFGWAVHSIPPNDKRYTICGTAEYLAPEMVRGSGHDQGVDLWALGILIYELLFGRTPFVEKARQPQPEDGDISMTEIQLEAQNKTYERIKSFNGVLDFNNSDINTNDHTPTNERMVRISPRAQRIIRSLLRPNSNERLSAENLLLSDWLSDI